MAQNIPITNVFAAYQEFLDEDQDIKEEIRTVVREMEQKAREILAILQGVHHSDGIKEIPNICAKARGLLEGVKSCYATLDQKIQRDQYYRFSDFWRFVTQRLSFICALIVYLESEELITREATAAMLGVKIKRLEGFHMDLEDFLMGLLLLANELSRLAVNAVTAGDYTRPLRISKFLCELDAGFRLLNLKNDSLRKRYDGLKYDVKKVEEVVYDVTIRNLIPKEEASTETPST